MPRVLQCCPSPCNSIAHRCNYTRRQECAQLNVTTQWYVTGKTPTVPNATTQPRHRATRTANAIPLVTLKTTQPTLTMACTAHHPHPQARAHRSPTAHKSPWSPFPKTSFLAHPQRPPTRPSSMGPLAGLRSPSWCPQCFPVRWSRICFQLLSLNVTTFPSVVHPSTFHQSAHCRLAKLSTCCHHAAQGSMAAIMLSSRALLTTGRSGTSCSATAATL